MVFYDPFSGHQLPWFAEEISSLSLSMGFQALPSHAHEIVASFLFYQAVFMLSRVLSPVFCSSYSQLNGRTKVNFDIHVVSMVQCLLILALCVPLFGDEMLSADRVNGYTPYTGFVVAMAAGYFVWDSLVCAYYYKLFGPGFLVHGLASLFVFIQGMRPYIMYYTPIFLLFEASTPFVNIHWFASHLPKGTIPDWLYVLNGVLLIVTFFFVRVLWGFYHAYFVACDILSLRARQSHPLWLPIATLTANISLDTLNLFWLYKMVSLVVRRFSDSKTKKEQ
ncbi:hypothetical protein TRVA0_044S00562 [Trichomonascus vanleenenianus]|uniref:TLC domain-containing protein n=1 Tax=Trichomonascus vanleenenianus TaxID=2268995 RepID=UPI003EC9A25E